MMVKTILVPTDFSANADSALNYAIGLAKKQQYAIQLIHVYQAPTSKFGDDNFNQDVTAHAESRAMSELTELQHQIQTVHPGLTITMECLPGDQPSEVLIQMAGKTGNDIIIMGTKGAGGLKHRLLGSNTYQTITGSPIPVLAIPEEYTGFNLDRAGLLSNFKDTEINLLNTFTSIFGKDIQFTLLHVREQIQARDQNREQEESRLIAWKGEIEQQTGIQNIAWKMDSTLSRLDVTETLPDCIHDMAEDADLQMLLVSYNSKSFFKRVFSKSLVKNFAHQIHRPVFFFKESLDNQK